MPDTVSGGGRWVKRRHPSPTTQDRVAPDPAQVAVRGERVALLPLPNLIELKLASGMIAPHRLKDLADVLELVRALGLPAVLAESPDSSVRAKYRELWEAAQAAPEND